jgi:hypothetical protein
MKKREPLTPAEMGRKGGKAKMAKLTPEQRSEQARAAAVKRWSQKRKEQPK